MSNKCPNYSLPQYSQLKVQYGEGGANLAANLFDSPEFQQWKGDGELPRLEGTTVFNNQGEGFDLSPLFQSRLSHLEQEWEMSGVVFSPARAQAMVEAFNQSRSGKNFHAHQESGEVVIDYKAPVLAPNGKPSKLFDSLLKSSPTPEEARSLYQQTQTPEFKKWFGKSKVVDENGEPLVTYHGTVSDFDQFETSRTGERSDGHTKGIFFTDNWDVAFEYTEKPGDESGFRKVIPAFLRIENPLQGVTQQDRNWHFNSSDQDLVKEEWEAFKEVKIGKSPEVWVVVNGTNYRVLKNTYGDYRAINADTKTGKSLKESIGSWFTKEQAIEYHTELNQKIAEWEVFKKQVEGEAPDFRTYSTSIPSEEYGVDGVILTDVTLSPMGAFGAVAPSHIQFAVFEPNQIKSIFNRGTFDGKDDRIAFSAIPSEESPTSIPEDLTKSLSPSGLGFFDQMDRLRVLNQERIDRAKKLPGNAEKVAQLEKVQAILNPAIEESKVAAAFIDSHYQDLFGDGGKKHGYLDSLSKRVTKVLEELGKPEGSRNTDYLMESFQTIQAFRQMAQNLDELVPLQHLAWPSFNPDQLVEDLSPLDKLGKIQQGRNTIDHLIGKIDRELLSSVLGNYLSKSAQKEARKYLDQEATYLLRAGEQEVAGNEKGAQKNRELAKGAREKYEATYWDAGKLKQEMGLITRDISLVGKLLEAGVSSQNAILSTFSLYLKQVKDRAQASIRPLQSRGYQELQDFLKATGRKKGDMEAFFAGLYEEVTSYSSADTFQWKKDLRKVRNEAQQVFLKTKDKEVYQQTLDSWLANNPKPQSTKQLHFVQEIDWSSYNQARALAEDMADGISNDPTDRHRKAVLANFYSQNTDPLTKEDREALVKERNRLVDEGEWTEEDFQDWQTRNTRVNPNTGEVQYIGEFTKPRASLYLNPRYQALMSDPAQKKFYDFLLETHKQSQAKYPSHLRNEFLLPSVKRKDGVGLIKGLVDKPGEWKDALQTAFGLDQAEDELRYGSVDQGIPVLYTQPMDSSQVSRDLLTSILLEAQAAATYQARQEALPLAQTLQDTLREAQVAQKDSKGRTIFNKAAQKVGVSQALTDQGEEAGGNLAQAVANAIDAHLFGMTKIKTMAGNVNVDKVLDTALGAAAWAGVSGPWNIYKHIANYLNAQVSVGLEVWGGKHIPGGVKQWGKAGMWVNTNFLGNGEAVRDVNAGTPVSKFGRLMNRFDVIPGKEEEEFGHHLTNTTGSKLWETVFKGGALKMGELAAQGQMFAAIALGTEVKGSDGTVSNLLDIFQEGPDGTLQVAPTFAQSFGEAEEQALRSKLRALSLSLHGNYNHQDKPELSRYAAGRVVLMYKKYLEPSIQRRFGQTKVNQQLGDITEGHYRTFISTIWKDWKSLSFLLGKDGSLLLPEEQARVKYAIKELAVLGMLALVAGGLKGLGDEDEDLKRNYTLNALRYQVLKMESELSFFVPVVGFDDQLRIFSSPTALTNPVQKAYALTHQLLPWNLLDTYQKGSRFHAKGDSKTLAAFQSLLGFNGLDMERALTQFERTF